MLNAEAIEMRPGTAPQAHKEIVSWVEERFINIALGNKDYLETKTTPKNPIKSMWTKKEYEDDSLGRLDMWAEETENFFSTEMSTTKKEKILLISLELKDPYSFTHGCIKDAVGQLEQERDPQWDIFPTNPPSLKLSDVIFPELTAKS